MQLMTLPVSASLFSPLYTAFGWVMQQLYSLFNSYGLMIILFTVFLRGILIPLNIRSHKNTLKQQALSKDLNELSRIYGDDRMGLQEAQQALYKKHGISMGAGCLFSILPMLLIWPVYRIISAPLRYIVGVPIENLHAVANMLSSKGFFAENMIQVVAENNNIPLMGVLRDNPSLLAEAVNKGWMKVSDMMNFDFLGMDLSLTPQWKPAILFGEESSVFLPLLAIAVLAMVTTFLVSKVQEWTNPMYWKIREEKKLARNNPARTVSDDATSSGMMKGLKWTMPIFTLVMMFSMPAAMGLYWIAGNLMSVFQTALFYYLYTKPTYANMAAAQSAGTKRKKGTA